LWTLPPETTLFVNLEAGDLSVQGWGGDSLDPGTWDECRDLAVYLSGPDPSLRSDQPYSEAHYQAAVARYGDPAQLDKYRTIFVDSITVAGRLCLGWCKGQPQAYAEKTGKPDMRGAYGLHGQEMIGWLTRLQRNRGRNVWLVGILNAERDDFGRMVYEPQIDGSKTGRELPGIVDQVVSMAQMFTEDGQPYRAFVCQTLNPWGYPAKDRSGKLYQVEEPHLSRLMEVIRTRPLLSPEERLKFTI
jgi:hypothetical protein